MEKTRTILITGVSRGLGNALAEEFIRLGHTVAGCARDGDAVRKLSLRHTSPHLWHAVDVRDDEQVRRWAGEVIQKLGPPDLLLNNAALINRSAPLWELSPAEFADVIDVNINGVFHVLRHFLPPMIDRRTGIVVNFSSGWGRSTSPEVAPYCATKFAIEGLTQALAQELPSGMAAIPLNPGIIDTEMLRSCFGASAGSYHNAEKWAKTAAPFLLNLSTRHNGQSLTVAGTTID